MNVYDFDDTILNGDSTVRFCLYAMRYPAAWRILPRVIGRGVVWLFRQTEFEAFKETLFSFLPYIPQNAAERFWDKNFRRIKPMYFSMMRSDDIIITASPEFLVKSVMSRLGPMRVIGTIMDPRTGRITGKNCKREEKVVRLRKEMGTVHIDAFYSDSLSDTPLARLADNAYLVKGEVLSPWPAEEKQ